MGGHRYLPENAHRVKCCKCTKLICAGWSQPSGSDLQRVVCLFIGKQSRLLLLCMYCQRPDVLQPVCSFLRTMRRAMYSSEEIPVMLDALLTPIHSTRYQIGRKWPLRLPLRLPHGGIQHLRRPRCLSRLGLCLRQRRVSTASPAEESRPRALRGCGAGCISVRGAPGGLRPQAPLPFRPASTPPSPPSSATFRQELSQPRLIFQQPSPPFMPPAFSRTWPLSNRLRSVPGARCDLDTRVFRYKRCAPFQLSTASADDSVVPRLTA